MAILIPRFLLPHGALGMDEDREGCDQGLECLVERIWGFLETVEKGRGIEQAGPRVSRVGRCGVSGQ